VACAMNGDGPLPRRLAANHIETNGVAARPNANRFFLDLEPRLRGRGAAQPRRRWNEGRLLVDRPEDLCHAARILLQGPHAEQDIARGPLLAARGLDLFPDLAGRPAAWLPGHAAGDQARPDV